MRETTVEVITNKLNGESYKLVHHKSGLDLLLAPMKDFVQTFAMFGTNYGSINNCFKTSDDEDFITVPEGIAHYLEHKLFENEDTDVFELYAQTGADGNAMTGFESTVYLFSCTENYKESLRILLDFVQKPYFTKENVEKEQGIIAQEIKMTMDLPKRKCFFNLLQAMFHNHPVKDDIAGTVDSIAEITPELLYKCYGAFYNLHNMVLSIAGNIDENEVIAICDEYLKPCEDMNLEVKFPEEPYEVVEKKKEEHFDVGVPIFNIGFKCKPYPNEILVKKEVEADLLLSLLADKMSPLHKRLMDEELITGELGREVFDGKGYFTLIFSGESKNPEAVLEIILEYIENARKNGLDREVFELLKKAEYGSSVRDMNYPDGYAEDMMSFYFYGLDAFEFERRVAEVTFEDVTNALDEFFSGGNCSISIIR
jgi:predicted Zn-dependent peptidase